MQAGRGKLLTMADITMARTAVPPYGDDPQVLGLALWAGRHRALVRCRKKEGGTLVPAYPIAEARKARLGVKGNEKRGGAWAAKRPPGFGHYYSAATACVLYSWAPISADRITLGEFNELQHSLPAP